MAVKIRKHSVENALNNRLLVRFERKRFDNGATRGFILDFNEQFTLLNEYDDDAGVMGFSVFRNKHFDEFKVYDDVNSFDYLALQLKQITSKVKPDVAIETIQSVIESASRLFPLIVIHRENLTKEAVWIGKLLEIKKNLFVVLEIDPNAEWHKKPTRFKYKDVTKIEFGNGYENDLNLVAKYRGKKP